MVSQCATRGPRLARLLTNFGLSPTELAHEDPKKVISTVKAAYRRLAKEQHPDVAPETETKGDAADRFVQLRGDYDEAVKLLEHGVRPVQLGAANANDVWERSGKRPNYQPVYEMRAQYFQHRPQQEFSTVTRIKGNLVFWSGLAIFLLSMREFLVWSAGSTYSWTPGSGANPFYIRRFQDDWDKGARAKASTDLAREAENREKEAKAAKKERGVDNFYQKRGISNTRRKTEPRGWGSKEI